MSDRICLMDQGQIVQLDTPDGLYFHPETVFAADFLGESNLLDATVRRIRDGVLHMDGPDGARIEAPARDGIAEGQPVKFMVRPESVRLLEGEETADNALSGALQDVILVGQVTKHYATLSDGTEVSATSLTHHRSRALPRMKRCASDSTARAPSYCPSTALRARHEDGLDTGAVVGARGAPALRMAPPRTAAAGARVSRGAVRLPGRAAPLAQPGRRRRRAHRPALRASARLRGLRQGAGHHVQHRGVDHAALRRGRLPRRLPPRHRPCAHPQHADPVGADAVLDKFPGAHLRLDGAAGTPRCGQRMAAGPGDHRRPREAHLQLRGGDDRHGARADAARHRDHAGGDAQH